MQIYNLSLKMFNISLNSLFSNSDKSGINSLYNFDVLPCRNKNLISLKELWVINLSLCVWMEHELCPNCFILLDQGYIPGLFGVSHGALQYMAYEELKKGNSQYFGTPINKKLVNTVCTCLYSSLNTSLRSQIQPS